MGNSSWMFQERERGLKRMGRVAALCAFMVMAGVPTFAQQNATPAGAAQRDTTLPRDTDLTVTISKVNCQPGKEVSVPVMFSRKEGAANLAKLRVLLKYPGKALKYARFEDAYMSRRVKMVIQANEQQEPQAQSAL